MVAAGLQQMRRRSCRRESFSAVAVEDEGGRRKCWRKVLLAEGGGHELKEFNGNKDAALGFLPNGEDGLD